MGEPARKLPADWEEQSSPESADPFRYGWRWRIVRQPNGEVTEQQIPLTAEDLLDPELGDEVPQSIPHSLFTREIASLLSLRFRSRSDVLIVNDVKMLWGIPGLKEPSPDVAVIPGMRTKYDPDWRSFDVVEQSTRPCLVIEVVSPPDPALRENDYEKKVKIYQRAGVPEYLIIDPPFSRKGGMELVAYRLGPAGRYRRIQPDARGFLLSETTDLLFGVAEDGKTLLVLDAQTGERVLPSDEQAAREAEARKAAEDQTAREAEARKAAEDRAAREAEARKAAEAEIARLRAELEKARKAK
ncbi:MAG TPA: Uma2 family endonuclease [Thermoanaerobaculia bacterium]|nr:Uma2 family endonuclease [Thermoanaerobaculia bacterium]